MCYTQNLYSLPLVFQDTGDSGGAGVVETTQRVALSLGSKFVPEAISMAINLGRRKYIALLGAVLFVPGLHYCVEILCSENIP